MSRYDDDYDDNEDELDDDDNDGEEGVRRSTSNPFSSGANRPSSVRGAGLPQSRPPNNADGSTPSPIRSGGVGGSGGSSSSGGNSLFPQNRPNPGQNTSGGSSFSAPNRPAPSSGGGSGSSGSSSSPFSSPNRPGSPSGGTSGGSSFSSPNRPGAPSGGSSGSSPSGVQPYSRSPVSRAPADDDDKDDERGGNAPSRMLGNLGQKLGGDSSKPAEKPAGGNSFGSRLGGGGSSSGGSGSSNDSSTSRLTGGLGGLTSRLGGGDEKKDNSSGGGGLGGLTSRFGGGDKKDEKKPSTPGSGGGGLGGLTSRFGGGDKKDNKSASAGKTAGGGGGLGGLTSRFGGGGDKKDSKPSDGGSKLGGLGGLTSRFGGGDKKDSGGSSTSSSSGFGNNRPGQSSSLGGGSSTSRPGAGGSSFGGSASSAGSMGGSSRAPASGGKSGANKQAGVPLMQRLRSLNPFTKQNEQIKSRASKAPRVDSNGLSLDNKLDILGVFLILSSLVLLLSSLSPTKGAITESLNRGISYLFGWGAVGVLLVIFAVGVWLILRHFGDEAPVIPRTRLIGLVMLFLGIMVAAQYIDAFQYKVGANQDYLGTVKTVFLPIAYSLGRGGGWIGGEIYFQLLSNFGEIGGFMVMVGWILVSIMLALSLSASDMAVVVISNARNLGDVLRQRNQQRAAQRAAKQQALATATQQISITKPVAEPLPAVAAAASQAALPAPSPEAAALPDRRIPITTGGRTSSVAFRAQGMDADAELDDEMQGANMPGVSIPAEASIPANALGKTGLFGGIGSRVRAAIPVGKQEEDTSGAISSARANAMLDSLRGVKPADADEKPSERKLPGSGLLPFGKKTSGDAKPESNGASQSAAEKAASLRGRLFSNTNTSSGVSDSAADDAAPAASLKPADAPSQSRFNPAARLGGLAASLSSSRSLVKDEPEVPAATPSVTASAVTSTAEAPAAPGAPPMNARERAIARARAAAAQADSEAAAPPQPADPLVTPSVSAPAAELPTAAVEQAATTPVEASTQTAPAASVTTPEPAASTPAETTPRLGDLLGRFNGNKPAGEAAVGNGSGQPGRTGGVQPFQRPPLSRPDVPKPETPAARTETPMPDLQSRMRALREAETQKPTNPAGKPPQMPAAASAEASAAFGKPSDPPFAVPRSTLSPDAAPPRRSQRNWMKPDPADLLSTGTDQEPDHDLLLKRAHLIEETLESFGAPGRVVDVRTGPVVTQFGVEPDYVEGRGGKKNRVKVGAIAALDKDLQLALGAKAIRIEAPVPGKGYVGIEVPNAKPEIVHLRDVLESAEFKKVKSPLAIALGQGVDGTPVAADLASMPHLLIAGTTGSGKSVCVNTIIASMLINNSPKTLKFIMVDPKRVELTQYNGIPHLIAPVVVELERIVSVLKWVTREMDERYRKFANAASRNIEDYNKHLPATEEAMPYIVVIIDELADLMMLAPDDTERVITRIAALARATGIHLVIATQRPSVDVVTGLIKANFPARVAFAVAGNTDSRVILDQPGAERLLGRGDMLYMSGDAPAPQRLQGVWVSDTEIGNITRFWRGQMSEQDIIDSSRPLGGMTDATRSEGGGVIMKNRDGSSSGKPQVAFWDKDDDDEDADFEDDDDALEDGEDEMYEQAVELVRRLNKASVSLLQRRLRIGYTRAARMIDTMEERGVVGPATEGSKPRDVLPVR